MNLVTRIQPVINAQTHTEGRERIETNTWPDNMDKFVSFVKNMTETSREVKVAVIDDEVDKLQEDFEDSIIAGISFFSSHKNGLVSTRPYSFSSNGHGTLIAKTIRRLCPKVKLYVAWLDQGLNGEPTIESAIKAISWATAMGVDIISMSWTFPVLRDSESRRLSEVIDEAHKNNILTFSSVSDQGHNQPDISFPAKIPGVFRIGTARHSGVPDDLSQGYEFVFPGGSSVANVRQREEGNTDANSNMVLASSFATAVASGLAALILHCVELCNLGDEYGNDIRQYQNMKDIFHVMASGSPQSSYIRAEKWFPAGFENKDWMEDEDQDEFRRRITAIIA
ncbi:peptidase S8/S53 domain-containing protein [Aspergillus transmontanensis]|uniref:Peptidase S8/S53 domain-containing protein n=1 Tax=Aspergillus transmontanensis TaxID=1034304 RepID=A0A5N6W5B8_9EURO|nr:peptidase S8/S53 domain-containing protein [Aspergillus transmontanensis]